MSRDLLFALTAIVIGAGLVLLGALLLIGRDLVLCTPKLRGRNPV